MNALCRHGIAAALRAPARPCAPASRAAGCAAAAAAQHGSCACCTRRMHSCATLAAAPAAAVSAASVFGASPASQAPSRASVLSTYRSLRRTLYHSFFAASQYATYDDSMYDTAQISGTPPSAQYRKRARGSDELLGHVTFADARSGRWLLTLREAYNSSRAACSSLPPAAAAQLAATHHRTAQTLLEHVNANLEHSRELLVAGWGLRRSSVAQVASVANRVGLQLPKVGTPSPASSTAGAKYQRGRA